MAHGTLENGIVTAYPVQSNLEPGQSQLDQAEQNGIIWLHVGIPDGCDRNTHRLVLDVVDKVPAIAHSRYVERYQLIPLDSDEIELDWQKFQDEIIDTTPGTPYWQVSEWAKTLSKFADSKTNILGALLGRQHDWLIAAMGDLKAKAILTNSFTQAQINMINHCLEVLRVSWRWEDL
jgi:hypothetical protein